MSLIKKWFLSIEFFYYALLPFLGYWAIHKLEGDIWSLRGVIIFGWIVLLYYQITKWTVFDAAQKKKYNGVIPLIPPFLIGLNHAIFNGTLWHFFLEQTMLEVVALMIGLCLFLLLGKGKNNQTMWEDKMTVIAGIVLVIFFLGGMLGFVTTWINVQFYTTQASLWNILSFLLAFGIATHASYFFLSNSVKNQHTGVNQSMLKVETNIPENVMGILIFGQIVIWTLVIPMIWFL